MSTLVKELPAVPFGSYSDCLLLHCPYSDSLYQYRAIVFNADGSNYLQCSNFAGNYTYAQHGCNIRLPYGACAEYRLIDGVWVQNTANVWMADNNIFVSLDDVPPALGDAGYPISSTFDLVLDTAHTPYASLGGKMTVLLADPETSRQPVFIVDSILSADRMTTPVLTEFYGLLPLLIPVLVAYLAIRKGIAFLSCRLRGA